MNIKHATSPWTQHTDKKSTKILGFSHTGYEKLEVPGSKSFSNRALIIAASAKGESHLTGLLKSDDTYWCIDVLKYSKVRALVLDNGVRHLIVGSCMAIHSSLRLPLKET